MKNSNDIAAPRDLEAIESRVALRLAAGLTELTLARPTPDIDERLRVARLQAVQRAAAARRTANGHHGGVPAVGTVFAGAHGPGQRERAPWWLRLAAVAPLVVLIVGLAVIQQLQLRAQIEAAAEIDAALLTDDLPPAAYADPGFVAFLKSPPPPQE